MRIRSVVIVAVLWVLSLFAVGSIVRAQVYRVNPVAEPRIVAGPDFGIRVEGERNGVPVGLLVIRIDGEWVEVQVGSARPPVSPAR
jgi:hypothetical protein